MSFTIQSASVPVVETDSDARIGPAMTTIFGERLASDRRARRARRREALVLDHPQVSLRRPCLGAPRHRLRGIADELIGGIAIARRRRERQRAVRVEVERALLGAAWRPGVEAAPLVGAGLEDDRLGAPVGVPLSFRCALEERQLDVLRGSARPVLRPELDLAEHVARHRRPAAVQPRADDDGVLVVAAWSSRSRDRSRAGRRNPRRRTSRRRSARRAGCSADTSTGSGAASTRRSRDAPCTRSTSARCS